MIARIITETFPAEEEAPKYYPLPAVYAHFLQAKSVITEKELHLVSSACPNLPNPPSAARALAKVVLETLPLLVASRLFKPFDSLRTWLSNCARACRGCVLRLASNYVHDVDSCARYYVVLSLFFAAVPLTVPLGTLSILDLTLIPSLTPILRPTLTLTL